MAVKKTKHMKTFKSKNLTSGVFTGRGAMEAEAESFLLSGGSGIT